MSFEGQYDLATGQSVEAIAFRKKVEHAIVKSALAIKAAGPEVLGGERKALARLVLYDPVAYAALFAKAVVTNAAITSASIDSDIEFTVNSMWDAFAVGS